MQAPLWDVFPLYFLNSFAIFATVFFASCWLFFSFSFCSCSFCLSSSLTPFHHFYFLSLFLSLPSVSFSSCLQLSFRVQRGKSINSHLKQEKTKYCGFLHNKIILLSHTLFLLRKKNAQKWVIKFQELRTIFSTLIKMSFLLRKKFCWIKQYPQILTLEDNIKYYHHWH